MTRDKTRFNWLDHAKALLKQDHVAAGQALDLIAEQGHIQHAKKESIYADVVQGWLDGVKQHNSYQSHIMVTYRNVDVQTLNNLARQRLEELNYLDRSEEITVTNYDKEEIHFAPGDRIMCLRKNQSLGIEAGAIGSIRRTGSDRLNIRLDTGQRLEINTRLYSDLAHGYCVNIHKSANLKVDNTNILATRHFDKQSFASALEVHRRSFTIYHSFESHNEFSKAVTRPRDKELAAGYPMESKAYKISVTLKPGAKPIEKYVLIDPQINKENERRELDRLARTFAQERATMAGINPEEVKNITIRVEVIPVEKNIEHDRSKHRDKHRGLDR